MTQEDKELLLKDLCARLPYGVKVDVNFHNAIKELSCDLIQDLFTDEKSLRPFLHPMSSMTEEESKEFALLQTDFYVDGFLYPIAAINMVNWLNEHHFDYRGLIPMGLALEAPEGMYNTKTE